MTFYDFYFIKIDIVILQPAQNRSAMVRFLLHLYYSQIIDFQAQNAGPGAWSGSPACRLLKMCPLLYDLIYIYYPVERKPLSKNSIDNVDSFYKLLKTVA